MKEIEKATWEFLFNTPSVSLLKHGSPYSDFVEAVTSDREKAFKAGAEWQKKQLIEKACEWLSDNCDAYKSVGYEGGHHVLQRVNNNVIEDFKKAMEEQQ